MFAQRFFRGRINGFSSQNVELRQVQRTCDAISGQKAHGQVVLFMSTGSIPSVDCTVQVHDEDPFTIVLYSFHRPRGSSETGHTLMKVDKRISIGTCSVSRTDQTRHFLSPVLLRIPVILPGLEGFVLPYPATSLQ